MNKKIVFAVSLLMALILISNVLAITAKIGNARMILGAEVGDEIEKSVKVINDNDVPVEIKVTASGDLSENTKIENPEFSLQANEEKNVYFTIKIKEAGKTETNINVQFTPAEGNGAGISSTVIIIAGGETIDNGDDETDNGTQNNSSIFGASNSITGNIIVKNMEKKYVVAVVMTGIMLIIFIVLLIIYYKSRKKGKKDEEKQETKVVKTKLKKSVKKRV